MLTVDLKNERVGSTVMHYERAKVASLNKFRTGNNILYKETLYKTGGIYNRTWSWLSIQLIAAPLSLHALIIDTKT